MLENGLRIAEANGADREVVTLFALFHDSRRVNEDQDDGHGLRGGELARSLRGQLVHLDDDRFDLLFEACRLHTEGHTVGDRTLLACWDADRLDLGRVGITPTRTGSAPRPAATSCPGPPPAPSNGMSRRPCWRRGGGSLRAKSNDDPRDPESGLNPFAGAL